MSLFVGLGDGVMSLLEKVILQKDVSIINIDTQASWWSKFIVAAVSLAVMAVAVVSVIATGGATIGIALGVAKSVITIGAIAVVTFPVTTTIVENMLPGSFYLPLYSITPDEIFSNKVLLLDVDFFNPSDNQKITKVTGATQESTEVKVIDKKMDELKSKYGFTSLNSTYVYTQDTQSNTNEKDLANAGGNNNTNGNYKYDYYQWEYDGRTYQLTYSRGSQYWKCTSWIVKYDATGNATQEDRKVIFENIRDTETEWEIENEITSTETIEIKSTAKELRSIVSNWYRILRDISVVALLSILVYTGIRIIISSAASDKAKYKQMLIDWIVAICLLFVMQYIMAFSNLLVKKFINLVDSTVALVNSNEAYNGNKVENTEPELIVIEDKDKVKKAWEALISEPLKNGQISSEENSPYYSYFLDDSNNKAGSKSNSKKLVWPAENFVQQARIKLQLLDEEGNDVYVSIGWKLIYAVLVIYTIIFLFTYVKRVVYMAFLTLIAPLVALTYSIDKMNDGKAQAFDMWLKEYIFNLLIQPMHLILYTILIRSAMDFASKNIVYVIVALGFMVPAEKLLRKFFGFEKAQTPGLLSGPAGAAMMMNGMNRLFGRGGPKGRPGSNDKKDLDGDDEIPQIDTRFDKQNGMIGADDIREYGNSGLNPGGADLSTLNSGGINPNVLNPGVSDPSILSAGGVNSNVLNPGGASSSGQNLGYTGVNAGTLRAPTNRIQVQKPKRRKLKNIARGAGNATRYWARKSTRNNARKIANRSKNLGRDAIRFAGGVGGAALVGSAGLMTGIVSGDISKGAQYMAGGATMGYKFGSGLGNSIYEGVKVEGAAEAFERGSYDSKDDYNMAQHLKAIEKYQKDPDKLFELENQYGAKEAKEIMQNVVPEYINDGVTDLEDIMAAYELEKNGIKRDDGTVENIDRDMAISISKYSKRIGKDTTNMTAKKRDEWRKTFSSEFSENEVVQNNNIDSDKMADTILRRVDAYNKAKKKL